MTNVELERARGEDGKIVNSELEKLIGGWMTTEEFRAKRRQFLRLTLQQTPADGNYFTQFRNTRPPRMGPVRDNLSEMFIRTAERIIDANEDFRTVVSTTTWEVTTIGLLALKMADNPPIRSRTGNFSKDNLNNDFTKWSREELYNNDGDANDWRTVTLVHDPDSTHMISGPTLESSEYQTFEAEAEANIAYLRSIPDGGTVVLRAPRVGFFTTPAFFQTWFTNADNDFRVTVNQALLVATGRTFSPGDTTALNAELTSVDPAVFPEDSDCYGCHKNLDPMRMAFLQGFDPVHTRHYVPGELAPPDFSFQGHSRPVSSMQTWAQALASHPNFARAWVVKLCQWATSAQCDPNDSRVVALATAFEGSGFRMNELFKRFFASSLATDTSNQEDSKQPGAHVGIARYSHFCHASRTRLLNVLEAQGRNYKSIVNLCDINDEAETLSSSIPEDTYRRGEVYLNQPTTMEPFTSVAYEGLCALAAPEIVAVNTRGIFDSTEPEETLDLLTVHVLGMPEGSERFQQRRALLQRLYDVQTTAPTCDSPADLQASVDAPSRSCGLGLTTEEALQNIWTIACQSPALTGVGL